MTADQAAACHRAFVEDTAVRLSTGLPGVATAIAGTPSGSKPWLEALARRCGLPLVEQCEGDLGARMRAALLSRLGDGGACVIVGADTPDLPASVVGEAFAGLETASVAVGPSADGGYYLIGARGAPPPVFELEAAWGSSGVFAETMERLRAHAIEPVLLPEWRDVDRIEDLVALARRIARTSPGCISPPRATAALLDRLVEEGIDLGSFG